MVAYSNHMDRAEAVKTLQPVVVRYVTLTQRVKLTYVAAMYAWTNAVDVMSNSGTAEQIAQVPSVEAPGTEPILDIKESNIEAERKRIIVKLLVDKRPATPTDLATLRDMRYQKALQWVNGIIEEPLRTERTKAIYEQQTTGR